MHDAVHIESKINKMGYVDGEQSAFNPAETLGARCTRELHTGSRRPSSEIFKLGAMIVIQRERG